MNFVRAYDYLTQARAKLFDWTRPLSQEQYTHEFPFAHRTLRATMLEMATAEWLYGRRLIGETVPPRDQWPFSKERQPAFAPLGEAWTALAPETRRIISEISDWDAPIEYRATRPDRTVVVVNATTGDIAAQMCFHEVHHRAQAMAMLRQLGVAAQNLDYSLLMFRRREEPA